MSSARLPWALVVAAAALSCAPSVPSTHLYRLQLPAKSGMEREESSGCERPPHATLVVHDVQVARAYDDPRMVYRESEYQLERYDYHQWAAPPGELVSDALADGYAASGCFVRVERANHASATAAVHGRLIALEEVDLTKTQWVAHLRLELELLDTTTQARLWSHEFELTQPMAERSPSGLAAGTSAMLREVVDSSATSMAVALCGP